MIQLWYLLFILLPWTSQACSCSRPYNSLSWAFRNDPVILQAILLERRITKKKLDEITYSFKIIRVWKGCSVYQGESTFKTNSEGSLCGVPYLKLGTTYLFSPFGLFSTVGPKLSLCNLNTPWDSVNATEVELLSANYTNCFCLPSSCGQQGAPNYLCPDRVTVAGPTKCSYNQSLGACTQEVVKCPTCQKQQDCQKGQFCSAGLCRAIGTCAGVIDCWNEQNIRAKCTNVPRCRKSKCVWDCSHPCRQKKSLTKCATDPCEGTSCNVPNVSCVSNYCGGCQAFFYNSSGHQVCTAKG